MGFHGTDFSVLIDLGKTLRLENVVIGMLTNTALGIFPATNARVSAGLSRDLLRPCSQQSGGVEVTANAVSPVRTEITVKTSGVKARFIQVDVRCTKTLPAWHPAAGQKAWLFIDNILVNPSGAR